MNEAEPDDESEVSFFSVATTVLRDRWRIAFWMFIGGVIAGISVFSKPSLYRASASFVPQNVETGRSGLSSLAGQFGVTLPTSGQAQSPDFYSMVLKSRVVLEPIARDTFTVPEKGGAKVAFFDLFRIQSEPQGRRVEDAVTLLQGIVGTNVARTTGLITVTAAVEWPSVSLAIVNKTIDGINEYNQRTRQDQAGIDGKLIQERLALASTELRQAEDSVQRFLMTNKSFVGSPGLGSEHERLQRAVMLRQQVYVSMVQSYEDVRIRRARDTPAITIVEPPSVRTVPESRGRIKSTLLGVIFGGMFGGMLTLLRALMARSRDEGSEEAEEFFKTLNEITAGVTKRFGLPRKSRGSVDRG